MAEKTKTVPVYYLGGLLTQDERGEFLPVQYVTALDRAFVLPPVGDALSLAPAVANDLIRRYTVVAKNGSYVSTFTEDARIAKLVKEGAYDPFTEQPVTRAASELSDEEIEREYKRRALNQAKPKIVLPVDEPEDEPEVEVVLADDETVVLEDAPARRGRKPKSEE